MKYFGVVALIAILAMAMPAYAQMADQSSWHWQVGIDMKHK